MAYSFPATISTGDVLTASTWNQAIRENQKFGLATFTNEAARDAAITSPEEGMMAYLTAPTVPAATGGTTVLPTGITTTYNGSAWVCVTPVSAYTSNTGTVATLTYTPTLSGTPGTNPSVTVATGTTALVSIASYLANNTGSGSTSYVSIAVSGATTLAASDAWALTIANNVTNIQCGGTFVISGLTAGTNTFTLNYKANNTGTFLNRYVTVQGIA